MTLVNTDSIICGACGGAWGDHIMRESCPLCGADMHNTTVSLRILPDAPSEPAQQPAKETDK